MSEQKKIDDFKTYTDFLNKLYDHVVLKEASAPVEDLLMAKEELIGAFKEILEIDQISNLFIDALERSYFEDDPR